MRLKTCCFSAALIIVLGCDTGVDPTGGLVLGEMQANQIMFDVHHYLHEQGLVRALLLADTAYVHEDAGLIDARQIRVTMYDERGVENALLTASSGEIRTGSEAMVARGEVVLITADGARRIETEELHFDPGLDRIWSEVETALIESGTVTRGTGFRADAQLRNVVVTDPRASGLRIPL